eukprot:360973-Chlamydomonas_euryale.AAC.13
MRHITTWGCQDLKQADVAVVDQHMSHASSLSGPILSGVACSVVASVSVFKAFSPPDLPAAVNKSSSGRERGSLRMRRRFQCRRTPLKIRAPEISFKLVISLPGFEPRTIAEPFRSIACTSMRGCRSTRPLL